MAGYWMVKVRVTDQGFYGKCGKPASYAVQGTGKPNAAQASTMSGESWQRTRRSLACRMSSHGIWLSTPTCHVGALGSGLSKVGVSIRTQSAQSGVTGGATGLNIKLEPQLAQNPRSAKGDDL